MKKLTKGECSTIEKAIRTNLQNTTEEDPSVTVSGDGKIEVFGPVSLKVLYKIAGVAQANWPEGK